MARSVEVKANWLDKTINNFFPVWGAKRMAARYAHSVLNMGGYRGASKKRPYENWVPGGGSADQDLLQDLPRLRERSRDLIRNNGVAAGAVNTEVTNVVGSGIKPQSSLNAKHLGIDRDRAIELQDQMETAWARWKISADSTNRLDFDDMQAMIQRQILENGEIIIQPLMVENRRPYSLCLELIEADRMDTPPGKSVTDKNIRMGVELGARSQPVAYWLKKTHPGDYTVGVNRTEDWKRVSAWNSMGRKNVFHLFHQQRPGQSRGVPWFTPALDIFKNRAEYLETEMVAARVAACFAVLVTSQNPHNMGVLNQNGATDSEGKPVEYLEPGMIKYLANGDSVTGFNPNRPGAAFEPFMMLAMRELGVALDMPYELIAKDFSQTNYSSARAALLEARKFFTYRQLWLSRSICQPVYEMVMEEAWLRGEIDVPDFMDRKREYCRVKWIPNGWQWVDPVKEANGNKISLENNMNTLSNILAQRGDDFDETMEQRARELKTIQELETEYGISFGPAGVSAPAQTGGNNG